MRGRLAAELSKALEGYMGWPATAETVSRLNADILYVWNKYVPEDLWQFHPRAKLSPGECGLSDVVTVEIVDTTSQSQVSGELRRFIEETIMRI